MRVPNIIQLFYQFPDKELDREHRMPRQHLEEKKSLLAMGANPGLEFQSSSGS
jgi:hypothetical protein